jgi:hypothetical protein
MYPDQAPEGGKFRAFAAAVLDGEAGVWGEADLLCVTLDSSGELILASAGDCDGVIWTNEGRKVQSIPASVIGGKKYTVFTNAEFAEADLAASPALSPGDRLYATALGDITTTPATLDIFVGVVVDSRLLINVSQPASA